MKVVLVIVVILLLWRDGSGWLAYVERRARTEPQHQKEKITHLLEREYVLEIRDYKLLYEQTGMAPGAVDALFDAGYQAELLVLQENLFAEVEIICTPNTIITREERAQSNALIPYIEEGDILVTFNCHAFVWRNGHAAIVVDAENRLAVEARQLGTESGVMSLEHWETYPAFAVLRLKDAEQEERAAIGDYARQKLVDIPYRLEAVKTGMQFGTHCAHLAWYAYKHYGHDIDNNGGLIVTPRDIFDSKLLQIVQIYGMPMPDFEEIY